MMVNDSTTRARPPKISEWEIKQARKLIELSQKDPLPSLLTEPELLECLYYPLRQVPLPQFQFEMLLWETDKLNIFESSKAVEISQPDTSRGILQDPTVVYKRTDDYTIQAFVYSLKSEMAAVFTNEISQTAWEIIGIFGVRDLAKYLAENQDRLHAYDAFEQAYTRDKQAASIDANEEHDDYWNRYDKELNSNEQEKAHPEPKTEEDYWKMYDENSDNDETSTNLLQASGESSMASKMILDLIDLYRDCGVKDRHTIAATIRGAVEPGRGAPQNPDLGLAPQIAYNHTRRVIALLKEYLGPAHKQAVLSAVELVEK